jgi:hypothetical protein
MLWRNLLTPSLYWAWYLKMEAATSFGTLVITYKTTKHCNPENHNLNTVFWDLDMLSLQVMTVIMTTGFV